MLEDSCWRKEKIKGKFHEFYYIFSGFNIFFYHVNLKSMRLQGTYMACWYGGEYKIKAE